MKKIYVLLLFILISLTGCVNVNTGEPTPIVNPVVDGVKVGDKTFVLNSSNQFKDMTFKYSNDFDIGGYENTMNIIYGSIDNPSIVVRFLYYEGKTVNDLVSSINGDIKNIKYNNYEWFNCKTKDNNGKDISMNFYNYKGNVYVVVFSGNYDLTQFEIETMNNIIFN